MSNITQLITDHLDIWTAADTEKKSGRGRASGNANSVYGIKKLRELILELAVRGKLVPQDPNDEPATELLIRIQAEKAKLTGEGKIKKEKPLAAITDDEKPYALPQSWEWVRLPEIYYSISVSGNQLLSSEIKESGLFPVVDQGQRFIAGYTDDETRLIRLPGPVVVFGDHTTERKYIDFDFVAGADGVKILRPFSLYEKFFWLQLVGLKLEGRGYARHFKVLNQCSFAVPPMNEQNRIVAKVDELMALCDQLEAQHNNAADAHEQLVSHLLSTLTQSTVRPELVEGHTLTDSPSTSSGQTEFEENWQRIATHFDTLFTTESSIDTLKQTLLQLAVMGKLVPQDPNDEPASELLKRIQDDKARLVVEGKIKKAKPLVEIDASEEPFKCPIGWSWVQLKEIAIVLSGNAFRSEDFNETGGIKVIKITNAGVNELVDSDEFLPEDFSSKYSEFAVKEGDLLLAMTRPYISAGLKISRCPKSYHGALLNQRVAAIKSNQNISNDFVYLYLRNPIVLAIYQDRFGDSGLQPNLKISDITDLYIPIPPRSEQERIMNRTLVLTDLCAQLKSRISQENLLRQKIADVLVAGVLN